MTSQQIPAAQYLRMSTDQQQYSIENQERQNLEFARRHGYRIVSTYSDPARSGLRLAGRSGLARLISDVVLKRTNYRALLVYDVSRWGRFQDIDEAAHYEFLCRSNGVEVHYCAEPFDNDGSTYSELLKGVKRVMAAEYSRKLGMDVYLGQRHLAELGYKMGGVCGFGLRRLIVSPSGKRKRVLSNGQQKAIKSDHVIQIAGPESEQKLVRRLYRMALTKTSVAILRQLNREGIKYNDGKPWTLNRINGVLTNIKYTGCNVWGRVSVKLSGKKLHLPREQWIIGPPTFKAIVSHNLYDKVQAARRSRWAPGWTLPDDAVLQNVARTLRKQGRLSTEILRREKISISLLYTRFGGLSSVYQKIGYSCGSSIQARIDGRAHRRRLRDQVVSRLVDIHRGTIQQIRQSYRGRHREVLLIDGHIPLTIQTTRCKRTKTGLRWEVTLGEEDLETIALICKTDAENKEIESFHIVERLKDSKSFRFREDDPWFQSGTRVFDLKDLVPVATRVYSIRSLSD